MLAFNTTIFHPSAFILIGFPGMEAMHYWLGFPLCSMYILAILGNCTILFIVRMERNLHEPMYLFLCMLAVIDLILSSFTMPKMIGFFWFDTKEIEFGACLTQMFFIHALSAMESTILLAMAFDRYIAICNPLRHSSILTNWMVAKIGMVTVIRGFIFFFPLPFLLRRLSYCRTNVLSHSFCLHQDMMKLSCIDTTVNVVYGLFIILSVMGIDSLFIILSYVLIVRSVLSLSSKEAGLKAFNTCISHICAVLMFYVPLIGLSIIHRFGRSASSRTHIIMADVYLLVPPVLNPIVYGIKTKQIRKRIVKILHSTLRVNLLFHCKYPVISVQGNLS
ncbi:olfactory receptor 51E2-like [Rhinatrema bivittatum]|uniref:olfactory receptor 51E2-like n=1 Tax=Rhinatrema bivittatum TaxID=194408 RepID=UPI00112A0ECA|nr:olfactory receptor 51E2-like [Rhinatrema bivittatum]